ncbi:AGAP006611-PA-like protein [Anopheles sinensis]|uniref:AGAP006611-PA-like protein n=1 Tax=Anopheles sinensis TaxID=74873 RepID=A0A084WGJ5_ANOSI|nr:AGAP006611-PA-like protein [Anopheles sinensis]
MNLMCPICSDLFVPSDEVHITPCGHMFHHTCLLQWLERSKTCPQCRNRCAETRLVKVYFNIAANLDTTEDSASLLQKLDDMTYKIREQEKSLKDFEQKVVDHKGEQKKMRKILLGLEDQLRSKESAILAFKHENDMLKGDRKIKQRLEEELAVLKPQLESYATIKQALKSTVQEVDQMLASDTSRATVVAVAAALKRELQAQEIKRKEQSDRIHRLQNELSDERKKRKAREDTLSACDSEIYRLQQLLKQKNCEKTSNTSANSEDGSFNEEVVPNTPDQHESRRKRPLNDLNVSTPMSEKVRKIMDSTSPYLRIKTSSIGLAPLMRVGNKISANPASSAGISTKPTSSTSQYSIFRNRRPADIISTISSKASSVETNEKNTENTAGDSETAVPEPRFKLTSSTVVARLKTGKLTRHPSTVMQNNTAIDQLNRVPNLELADLE